MKLLVAALTFVATMGMLFLFDSRKTTDTTEKNYAQILEGLNAVENPTAAPKAIVKKAVSKTQTATPAVTAATISPTPSATPSVVPTTRLTSTPVKTAAPVTPTITPTQAPTPAFAPTPLPTSTQSPESTGYQIEVISIIPTPPVKQNSTVQVNIKTAPETQCGIKVTLPSGSQSTAKGLEPKTADSSGNITWSWRINWNTKPGTAMIEINCSKDGRNFSRTLQMEIIE